MEKGESQSQACSRSSRRFQKLVEREACQTDRDARFRAMSSWPSMWSVTWWISSVGSLQKGSCCASVVSVLLARDRPAFFRSSVRMKSLAKAPPADICSKGLTTENCRALSDWGKRSEYYHWSQSPYLFTRVRLPGLVSTGHVAVIKL